jgi:hypothetical protein
VRRDRKREIAAISFENLMAATCEKGAFRLTIKFEKKISEHKK